MSDCMPPCLLVSSAPAASRSGGRHHQAPSGKPAKPGAHLCSGHALPCTPAPQGNTERGRAGQPSAAGVSSQRGGWGVGGGQTSMKGTAGDKAASTLAIDDWCWTHVHRTTSWPQEHGPLPHRDQRNDVPGMACSGPQPGHFTSNICGQRTCNGVEAGRVRAGSTCAKQPSGVPGRGAAQPPLSAIEGGDEHEGRARLASYAPPGPHVSCWTTGTSSILWDLQGTWDG